MFLCYWSVKFPDSNEYQVDFERNKYNDLYNEVRRFYKDFIQGEGSPYIVLKILKNYILLLYLILELIKIWLSSQSVQARISIQSRL